MAVIKARYWSFQSSYYSRGAATHSEGPSVAPIGSNGKSLDHRMPNRYRPEAIQGPGRQTLDTAQC